MARHYPRTTKTEYPGLFGPRVRRVTTDARGNRYVSYTNSFTELVGQVLTALLIVFAGAAALAVFLLVLLVLLLAWPVGAVTHSPRVKAAPQAWVDTVMRRAQRKPRRPQKSAEPVVMGGAAPPLDESRPAVFTASTSANSPFANAPFASAPNALQLYARRFSNSLDYLQSPMLEHRSGWDIAALEGLQGAVYKTHGRLEALDVPAAMMLAHRQVLAGLAGASAELSTTLGHMYAGHYSEAQSMIQSVFDRLTAAVAAHAGEITRAAHGG